MVARGFGVSQVSNQKYVCVPLFVKTKEIDCRVGICCEIVRHRKDVCVPEETRALGCCSSSQSSHGDSVDDRALTANFISRQLF